MRHRQRRQFGTVAIGVVLITAVLPCAQATSLDDVPVFLAWLKIGLGTLSIGYVVVATWFAVTRARQCRRLLEQISRADAQWHPAALKQRIEATFERLHMATRHRNPDLQRAYLSAPLRASRELEIEQMRKDGIVNRMQDARLKRARVVEVLDFVDDADDTFRALIDGERRDCCIDARSGRVLSGKDQLTPFREMWTFRREAHGWMLDEIDDHVTIDEIRGTQTFSEAPTPNAPK